MQYLPKKVLFGEEARKKVLAGALTLGKAVGATMGQKGRKVFSEREFDLLVTLDGINAAKQIDLKDRFEQQGVVLVREAAQKTNESAGDGTTNATVLSCKLMEEGNKRLASGFNCVPLVSGMEKARDLVIEKLKEQAKPIKEEEDFYSVAFISSRDEEIARSVAKVMKKVGTEGVVTVERSTNTKSIEEEYTEGLQFDTGYASYYFVNNREKMECNLENPFILIYDGRIKDAVKDLVPVMELIAKREGAERSLLIVADEVSGNALSTVHANNAQNTFRTLVVNPPEWGERRKEFYKDLAVVTGGTVINTEMGKTIKDMAFEDLGRARRVNASRSQTTIIEGKGEKAAIEGHIAELRRMQEAGFSDFDKDKIKERIARLSNGVVILKVGAATEPALNEKLDRVEDALGATKSAAEEGIVAGGGVALIRAMQAAEAQGITSDVDGEQEGAKLLFSALPAVCAQIAQNAGKNGETVVDKVKEQSGAIGFNVKTGKYEDMIEAKVIDPVKVPRVALENAVSVASMFLTMETAVAWDLPETLPVSAPQVQ